MHRTTCSLSLALIATVMALLAGCVPSTPAPSPTASPDAVEGDGHGQVEGAQEVAEPPLHLMTQNPEGVVAMYDLLADAWNEVGTVKPAVGVATDGRYLFSLAEDGVTIVDSGMWTWDHGDHFHYYRSQPKFVGTVPGRGIATVATTLMSTSGGTGLYFPGSGEAVLLDTQALSQGRLVERFRVSTEPHNGMVAPIGDGAFVTQDDSTLRYLDSSGNPIPELTTKCADPAGHITARVGLVIGCADGVRLATQADDKVTIKAIPYPKGASRQDRARQFDNREGRPTVAARAGDKGFWLFNTRAREWRRVQVDVSLRSVIAVDDNLGHVLALDTEGRVRVFSAASGKQLSATDPLLPKTLGSPSMDGVRLTADANRAYLNAPLEGVIYEIDYADDARIARTLRTPTTPAFYAEVGR